MSLLDYEIDPNVVDGRSETGTGEESTSEPDSATYLNGDQRGDGSSTGKPSLTIDEAAVQLTRYEASWGDYWGEAVNVTFAFRSTAPSNMPDDTSGFSRFNTAQINATLTALQAWSDVANITFTRVGSGTSGSGAYSNSATMLFGNYSSGAEDAAAFAYYPYSYAYSSSDGDTWINSSLSYNSNPQAFNYGYMTLLHEIGHAIGISHPADYNAGDDENITYAQHATYFEDSIQYTVMSYFYETYTGASYGSPYPATIMLDDIAAAQRLYGANMTTRTGDTVYGFNSNSDRAWFTANSSSTPLIFAVWDAGGTDTFDFSGYASNAKIQLREGYFSDVGGLIGNVAVAKGVVIENAIGGSGADAITGNAAANRLQGNAGADTLTGLAGADVFVFTTGGGADIVTDFVIGTDKLDATAFGSYISIVQSGADTVVNFSSTVSVRLTNVTASNLTDSNFIGLAGQPEPPPPPPPPPPPTGVTVNGTSGADSLVGGSGDDFLYGFAGADTLNGLTGVDAMAGGAGDDTYVVDNTGDTAVENANEGFDTVLSSVSFTLGANVEHLTLTGSAAINGTGNALNNRVYGNDGANSLWGGAGDDLVNGNLGADAMSGGAGNDSFVVENAGDTVIEAAGEGYDSVESWVSFTLGANVERLSLMGSAANATGNDLGNLLQGNGAANTLRGEAGDDTLYGYDGADTLIGGAGSDSLSGGTGADIFVFTQGGGGDVITDFVVGTDRLDGSAFGTYLSLVQDGADAVITFATGVTARVRNVSASSLTAASFIGVTPPPPASTSTFDGTSGADNLLGGLGNDILNGYAGADTLNGGAGADAMNGGADNDTYVVDNTGDTAVENANEGIDTVLSSVSFTLGANVEYLTLIGAGAVTGTGNTLNNRVYGNTAANSLWGGAGDDRLDGDLGADAMYGGAGDDSFVVENLGDTVIEAAGEGYDSVESWVSFTLGANVERLTLMGSAANGTGNDIANLLRGTDAANTLNGAAGDDILYGYGGADTLIGGSGSDALNGGAGDDTYVVDNAGDTAVENANEGIDTVLSSVSFTLGANVEYLTLTGAGAVNGTGNALNNRVYGNTAANVLSGGVGDDLIDGYLGADTMSGGLGDDSFVVENLGDTVIEAAGEGYDAVESWVSFTLGANVERLTLMGAAANGTGNDLANLLRGTDAANALNGAAGDDVIFGYGANDTLTGGSGSDLLYGGTGADRFVYTGLSDSNAAGADRIADFEALSDLIDLSAIDANIGLSGDQAFSWVGGFSGQAGQATLTYNAAQNLTLLNLDANGDGVSDFLLLINGQVTGDSGFIL